jgi:hypothetical protein
VSDKGGVSVLGESEMGLAHHRIVVDPIHFVIRPCDVPIKCDHHLQNDLAHCGISSSIRFEDSLASPELEKPSAMTCSDRLRRRSASQGSP